MRVKLAGRIVLIALLVCVAGAAKGATDDAKRLYLTVDKTQALGFQSAPISQISVTNPAIADVYVTSPTQVLISGKAPGRTTMIVMQNGQLGYFDVIVHPAPVVIPRAPLVPEQEHGVEVLRAGRTSHQLFVRDMDQAWIPLGTSKAEPEAPQK